jgi:hypothetical protein
MGNLQFFFLEGIGAALRVYVSSAGPPSYSIMLSPSCIGDSTLNLACLLWYLYNHAIGFLGNAAAMADMAHERE